ncbi:MAG TPA: murein biosynthesis integral membrane protein MurJ [Propionicimonas sp.]|jgi:murein biosynthesis integral membrane protein MurJ|nr:murein biosynthesis integral membrane protein MurJ [Propionicimonas sp.]
MADAGSRRLLGATAVMASGTMVSRVLGLARAVLIAFALGNSGMRVEVFSFAMTVPNSLYMLLAGGTLNNVLVPQIVRAVLHDEDQGKAFVDRVMTGFLLILGFLTVVLTFAVPWVMALYTSGSWRTEEMAEHWQSLLLMSYLTMPQLFFFGLFFLIGQVLNARDSFGPMMWAPIANNVVSIAVLGAYIWLWGTNAAAGTGFTEAQVWLLGAGSTVGIAVQTLVLLPYLRRVGFHYRPRFDLKGTGLGRTFHIAKWMVGYVALTSLAQIVVTNLASTATPIDPATGQAMIGAGLNAYQQGYLIWILPHSLLTVSLATAMLPAASRAAAAGDTGGVATETTRALRLATTFLLPASIGFLALADPIARLIFGNGAGADDYHFVAWTLMGFAVGLVPYTVQYLYLRAFYALDNTRTPFLLQIVISGANALFAVAFVLALDSRSTVAARLALAYSVAYWIGAWITHRALSRRLPGLSGRDTLAHLGRLAVASLPAGLAAWLVTLGFASTSRVVQALGLAVAAGVAVLLFFFAAKRLGVPETTQLLEALRRRSPSLPPDAAEVPLAVEEELELLERSVPLVDGPEAQDWAPPEEPVNPDPDGVGVFVPAAPAGVPTEALSFPVTAGDETGSVVDGLGDRYRLVELLAVRGRHRTWRAEDTVLDRAVLVHQLGADDARGFAVADAARRAALATDSRFLRVLDVMPPEPGRRGTLLVYEYTPGDTLQHLLGSGPLTGAETAWVVREISDALAELHAAGLHHRHLHPGTVLITSSGNVKIIGLGVEEALDPLPPAADGGAAEDVAALGRLLYAGLVARWPGGAAHGLPAAPLEDGRLLLPGAVRSGVAQPVEAVVDRILSPEPRRQASRLLTAADITTELSLVLGPSSAAGDLRRRLGHSPGAPSSLSSIVPPIPTPATRSPEVRARIEAETEGDATETFAGLVFDTPAPFTPVPPPPPVVPVPARPVRRGWVIGGLGLVLGLALLVVLTNLTRPAPATPSPSASPSVTRLTIVAADDFDPRSDGGSAAENPRQVPRAYDGRADTAWRTERYRGLATFGGLKPGVGLVLDLGREVTVSQVLVTLEGDSTTGELRVPAEPATTAPMKSAEAWRRVATLSPGVSDATFPAERTRFVLVYLTSLSPTSGGYFRGGITEVEVHGVG